MDKDISGERYKKWTEIIVYSGLPDYTKKPEEIEKELITRMHKILLLQCWYNKSHFNFCKGYY